ncbi:hypothetical protein D9615_007347 [Tricholomella constricta]|uniref:Uncharacterized protein n=1 Tax=Tricholomella constricta TaxID=117010 RepID=A0A8H5H578_9AGAR|nr:hypothetical protein D9615_007347 [Tricholomella constricta]
MSLSQTVTSYQSYSQQPPPPVFDIRADKVATNETKTFSCGYNDIGPIIGRITPMHSSLYFLDFVSADGKRLLIDNKISVLDMNDGPVAILVGTGGPNCTEEFYYLSSARVYQWLYRDPSTQAPRTQMTEYDFSPGAYDRYLATQRRIASWVDHTEGHRPEYGNAFTVQPAFVTSESYSLRSPPTLAAPSHHTLRASQSQYFCPSSQSHAQPQPRPATRHRSSANLRSPASVRASQTVHTPTYVGVPSASGKPAYVYAPSRWVATGGMVAVPSQNASVMISAPATYTQVQTHMPQPQSYAPTVQAYPYSTYQASPPPTYPTKTPMASHPHASTFTQTVYPPAYAYQENLRSTGTGAGTKHPLGGQVYMNTHTHTHTALQPVIMPFIERERGGRSKSVDSRKIKKKGGAKGGKGKESGKRSRSEARGPR